MTTGRINQVTSLLRGTPRPVRGEACSHHGVPRRAGATAQDALFNKNVILCVKTRVFSTFCVVGSCCPDAAPVKSHGVQCLGVVLVSSFHVS